VCLCICYRFRLVICRDLPCCLVFYALGFLLRYSLRLLGEPRESLTRGLPSAARLVWSERLDPQRALCAFDLHGRCASQNCPNLHIGNPDLSHSDDEVLEAVITDFVRDNEAFGCATPEMLKKGVGFAAGIARQSLKSGVALRTCVSTFLQALEPMSRLKLGAAATR
jgi:hypothetical protein